MSLSRFKPANLALPLRGYLLFPLIIVFSAIWSSAFVVGKIGTAFLDPFSLLGWRYAVSAVLLLPLAARRPGWRQRDLVYTSISLGLLNNVVYLGLTFSALLLISPALVIIIVSCAPFMTTLVAAMLHQERLISMKLLGITVGFCGVLVISLQQPIGSATVIGIALAAFGTLAFSIGTILYRWRAADFDPIQVNLWQSVTGAIIMAAIGLWFGRMPDTVDSNLALAVLYLAIVVTIGGMSIWMFLIRVSGPSSASSYHLLNPFFAVLLSHFAFGTAVTGFDVGGAILICIGLLLVTKTVAKEQA